VPNWCYNNLRIIGDFDVLNAFKNKYKSKKTAIDFNKVISNEKDKHKWIKKWKELSKKEKERWNKIENNGFETYWFNKSGYDWNIDNWGTKWNAKIHEPIYNNNVLEYSFQTAWTPPEKVIEKLIKENPKLKFYLYYEEEGNGFLGNLEGENGEIILKECFDCSSIECKECGTYNIVKDIDDTFVCCDCGTLNNRKEDN